MSQLIGTEDYGSCSVKNRYILTADNRVQLSSSTVRQWHSVTQFFRVRCLYFCT